MTATTAGSPQNSESHRGWWLSLVLCLVGYRNESRKSASVLKVSPSPLRACSVASRSPACHSGVQNHAWLRSIVANGRRSTSPLSVTTASIKSPSSSLAALRTSSGSVSCPFARRVVRAIASASLLPPGSAPARPLPIPARASPCACLLPLLPLVDTLLGASEPHRRNFRKFHFICSTTFLLSDHHVVACPRTSPGLSLSHGDGWTAMPTYTKLPRFQKDFDGLSADDQERFRKAVRKFIK